jgi:hypothetical protein
MEYIIILTETLDCPLPQDKVQGQRLALSNGTITVRSPHSTFHLRTWADPTSERCWLLGQSSVPTLTTLCVEFEWGIC